MSNDPELSALAMDECDCGSLSGSDVPALANPSAKGQFLLAQHLYPFEFPLVSFFSRPNRQLCLAGYRIKGPACECPRWRLMTIQQVLPLEVV